MPRSSFPVRRASRSQKKVKTHKVDNDGSGVVKDGIPRSVIVRQGTVSCVAHTPRPLASPPSLTHPPPTLRCQVAPPVKELVRDLRTVMLPYTAAKLKERRSVSTRRVGAHCADFARTNNTPLPPG